jgi:hypothetical protein
MKVMGAADWDSIERRSVIEAVLDEARRDAPSAR